MEYPKEFEKILKVYEILATVQMSKLILMLVKSFVLKNKSNIT